ncbi:DUF1932 domain-containing protein [Nocardia sp. NPDC059195]|uniref:NAD(P)-dependent oxidoreductase n=1 Tax=Nocardia sp. NPDC059195 TaxID=3346765 RepID=UPI0036A3865D
MIIGLLHPGNMGSAVGARLVAAGHTVLWHPVHRGSDTHRRAAAAGLMPCEDLAALLHRAETVLSICPSSAAIEVAEAVSEHNYHGVYVDANAISPQQMEHIAALLSGAGAAVVDAAIAGPPPRDGRSAKFFLSGPDEARGRFRDLLVDDAALMAEELGETPGTASALKMALISYQRPARLLAALSYGLADHYGVTEALIAEAERTDIAILSDRSALSGVAARAWRWLPELHEVAISQDSAGLPTGFTDTATKLYELLAEYKDQWDIAPELVIERMIQR